MHSTVKQTKFIKSMIHFPRQSYSIVFPCITISYNNVGPWAQVKKLKIEFKYKFFIKKITFQTFKTLNAQFSIKKFCINFLTYAPRAQVSISQ